MLHTAVKHGMERVEAVQRLVHGMLSLTDCLHSTWHKPLLQLGKSPAPAGGGQGSSATWLLVQEQAVCKHRRCSLDTQTVSTQTGIPCHCQEKVNRSDVCCLVQVGPGSFISSIICLPGVSVICGLTFFSR